MDVLVAITFDLILYVVTSSLVIVRSLFLDCTAEGSVSISTCNWLFFRISDSKFEYSE